MCLLRCLCALTASTACVRGHATSFKPPPSLFLSAARCFYYYYSELCIGRTLNTFKLTKCHAVTRQLMHVEGAHEERLTVSVPAGCLRADIYLDSYGGKYIADAALRAPMVLPFDLVPLPRKPLRAGDVLEEVGA